MWSVQKKIGQPAVRGPGRVPVAQQDAVGAGDGVEHDLAAVGDQHSSAGTAFARFHVLGEDKDLVS